MVEEAVYLFSQPAVLNCIPCESETIDLNSYLYYDTAV